jgi:hypothetical protein
MRLHDLYGLRRTPGDAAQAGLPLDVGRKKADGFWFEAGVSVLMFLLEKDDGAPGMYVPMLELLEFLEKEDGLNREDGHTVLRYLQTPCELRFPNFEPASVLEQTALVELAVAGTGYRISQSGRTLFAHANHAKHLDYAPDVVSMLFKDLDYGRFLEFSQNCSLLVEIIRDHAHKAVKVMERSLAYQEFREEILGSTERHQQLLHEVTEQTDKLHARLSDADVLERIAMHEERKGDGPRVLPILYTDLKRVVRAANALLRNLANLYESYHLTRSAGAVVYDLKKIMDAFWQGSLNMDKAERTMSIHGLWSLRVPNCSLFDVPHKLTLPKPKPDGDVQFSPPNGNPPQNSFFDFLRANRDNIKKSLETGPVSLKGFIDSGTLSLDDLEDFTALLGIYFNAGFIGMPEAKLRLFRNGQEKVIVNFPEGTSLTADDIYLDIYRR